MKAETKKKLEGFIRFSIEDPAEAAEALALLCGITMPERRRRDKWLTRAEAAAIAGVHPQTLFRWENDGRVHPKKITPRRVRFSRNEIEDLVQGTVGIRAVAAT